jgi:hypothetical protein
LHEKKQLKDQQKELSDKETRAERSSQLVPPRYYLFRGKSRKYVIPIPTEVMTDVVSLKSWMIAHDDRPLADASSSTDQQPELIVVLRTTNMKVMTDYDLKVALSLGRTFSLFTADELDKLDSPRSVTSRTASVTKSNSPSQSVAPSSSQSSSQSNINEHSEAKERDQD